MYLIKYSRVLIVGSGPSGYTSAIYISRSNLNPILLTGNNFNGQLINTNLENWPGFKIINGLDLMNSIFNQLKFMKLEILFDFIYNLNFLKKPFFSLGLSFIYFSDLIVLSTGSKPKFLLLKNENKYYKKNISFCSICDGNFYKNKYVTVVGGGNSSVENSLYLSNLSKKVFFIHRNLKFKSELILFKNLIKKKNIFFRLNFFIYELLGDYFSLRYIKIKNIINNITNVLYTDCLFISIGNMPNSFLFKGQLLLDLSNYILVKNNNFTNINGIFASGDIQKHYYKQAIISSGLGCIAGLDLINYYNLINY